MNRSGIALFFLFLFLAVIILLQFLGMMQSDRLYERVNRLESAVKSARFSQPQSFTESRTSDQNAPAGDEGDWLVWSLEGEPATLNDILTSATWYTRWIVSIPPNIFESLIEYEPNAFKFRGRAAKEFSISPDGLEIYFKLKKGVHFSDGIPITTDDIIFTFETIKNPKIDDASYANYFRDVDRYEKINDREIKFHMKQVYFLSLGYLGSMLIYPKHVYQFTNPEEFNKRWSNPVGSGPFVFEKWDVGRQLVLSRNERYWGEKPKYKKIVYKFITNDLAALQSLQAGEVDYLRPLPEQFGDKVNDKEFNRKFYCLSYWDAGNRAIGG